MAESEVESADRHTHCQSCYKTMCFAHTDCPTVPCGNGCSASYHACKQREHELVCRLEARPCVNRVHGCVRLLNSVQMIRHLEVCAASTVKCPASWNRYPLYSQIREKWLRKVSLKTNPVPEEGVLEVEWAIADQKLLNAQLTRRMKHGRDMISSRPKKVGSLSEQKISDLEQLLAPAKNKKTPKEEECEIMTYDEATAQHPEVFASVVQNTNIRDGYYDLPEPATTGRYGCQLSDDEEEDEQGSTKMHVLEVDVCFEPSEEQVSARQAKLMRVKLNTYPLGLNTVVETMPRFQNQYPMYSFTCGRVMRRDEYTNHYQNTHCDVQPHLNGWMLRRCPLASQGCPYTVTRLRPRHKNVRLLPIYGCVTATVETPVLSTPARTQAEFFYQKNTSCSENINVTNASDVDNFDETNSKNADNFDDTNLIKLEKPEPFSLEELHQDVLEYLFTFLDALSLNCIARTSAYLRAFCGNLLNKRGVIVHVWKRRDRQSIIPTTWCRSKQIRFFSTSCSLMRDWHYTDTPAMGEHLCTCAFFTRPKYGVEKIPALSAPLKREMEGKFKSKS